MGDVYRGTKSEDDGFERRLFSSNRNSGGGGEGTVCVCVTVALLLLLLSGFFLSFSFFLSKLCELLLLLLLLLQSTNTQQNRHYFLAVFLYSGLPGNEKKGRETLKSEQLCLFKMCA